MKPKIFLLNSNPPLSSRAGGIENLVRELSQRFEKKGYKTQLFHYQNAMPVSLQEPTTRIGRYIYSFMEGYFIGQMARLCLTNDVTAVISFGPTGWYPLHRGVPPFKQIHFYGGTYAGLAKALKPFISYRSYLWMTWIEGMVKEKFSGLGKLCLSNSAKTQEEVKHYFGLDSVVIWRPMDTTLFQPNDPVKCRLQLGLASEKPIGLFVGHTGLTKNFALVEQMTERFPDIQWVLALRDAIPPHLQGQSHIHLVHQATREHLRLLYNAADFSLCPSHYEPFGYVVAEALACGTPVIAAPGGASRLFLQHSPLRELFVHSSTDTEGFVRAIENVLADPATYRQAVIREIRPSIEEIMTPENWWARFINIVQL